MASTSSDVGPINIQGAGEEWTMPAGDYANTRFSTLNEINTSNVRELFPISGGVLVTAGDIVFYGTMDRWFKAVYARSGKLLWSFKTASGIVAPLMSFLSSDGHQYISIADGVGGWTGSIVSMGLDPRDGYADKGVVNAMADLPNYKGKGGTIYVFRLP